MRPIQFSIYNKWLLCFSVIAGSLISTYLASSVYMRAKINFDSNFEIGKVKAEIAEQITQAPKIVVPVGAKLSGYNKKVANRISLEQLPRKTQAGIADPYLVELQKGSTAIASNIFAVQEYGRIIVIIIGVFILPLTISVAWLASIVCLYLVQNFVIVKA
ncbi:MAG: hypothetical protein A2Y12_13100 [Planctomycetes bacterium GWF2_42_9]|nr:MAG: hypothetical protein A2Y12_13100 [Planctomycetes bacterium GWF2_42_9]